MKTSPAMMRGAAVVFLCPAALMLALAPAASADKPDPVQIDSEKPFGPVPGDFTASGAITDSGTFSNTNRIESAVPAPTHLNNHLTQAFVGENGSFTMRVQLKEKVTDDPNVFSGSGHWVITKGTGAYEGLHGRGGVIGTADDNTGVIDRTYTGNVHQTPSGPG
jgi:hypothetical protein